MGSARPDAAEIPVEAPEGLHALFLRGRFPEELNVELFGGWGRLAVVKIFRGRPPHYAPWAELFGASPHLYGSPAELAIFRWIHRALPSGSNLYAEYVGDAETERQLRSGVPPPATRLGAVLLRSGFLATADMYFPEGGREGGQKIRAVRL
jgi:hypothetical protein